MPAELPVGTVAAGRGRADPVRRPVAEIGHGPHEAITLGNEPDIMGLSAHSADNPPLLRKVSRFPLTHKRGNSVTLNAVLLY
ncbi:hypothetical protein [Actinomadura sp. BRA 177]|uniref:hypothetical protein n=1 Tax=Actinomadura sp. BRA 177 TaxID=2745202 RepID=UPI0015957876|nr:hypothetical protein [Actinomadura sp. BRA 177]NVI91626.1 hypothetical protein [Actinomadura sp. BRA 177]